MTKSVTLSATVLLRQRHNEIESLLEKTLDAAGAERAELFDCLRATLAVHEAVEEMFVHPLVRRVGAADCSRIVAARLAEEAEAARILAELEQLGPAGAKFGTRLALFGRAALDHAKAEERELFPIIDVACSEQELHDLADVLLSAEKLAPTHAHPHMGQNPLELMLVGPFVAMVDKARDHFSDWRAKHN